MDLKKRVFVLLLCLAVGVFFTCWDNSVNFFSSQKSSVCSCDKCLTDGEPWFRHLINESPEPFLSKTHNTSEETFTWWKDVVEGTVGRMVTYFSMCRVGYIKHLQGQDHNFTFFNTTVDNLFQIFPPIPTVVGSSPDRCRTCAVVGNSANLNGSHYGRLIDLHHTIIRMNRGRTRGYEADVGARTTHHVMYPESAVPLDNTTRLLLFPFKVTDLLWLLEKFDPRKASVNSKTIANKDIVMILNPAFMKYVHVNWLGLKGGYPSTGFLTFVLSTQLCDEVSVFGFGADSDGNWSHYFEKLKNKKLGTGGHPGKLEYDLIRQLHKIRKIHFY